MRLGMRRREGMKRSDEKNDMDKYPNLLLAIQCLRSLVRGGVMRKMTWINKREMGGEGCV